MANMTRQDVADAVRKKTGMTTRQVACANGVSLVRGESVFNHTSWMVYLVVLLALWSPGGALGGAPSGEAGGQPNSRFPVGAVSVDNKVLSQLFQSYETDTKTLVRVLSAMIRKGETPDLWDEAHKITISLRDQSSHLLELGKHNHNPTWEHYASNLYHHCLELEEAIQHGNGEENILLVAILISHLGQIQSANPRWLKWYLNNKLQTIFTGIDSRDKEAVRDAAEILHESASKILLSASVVPEVYTHQNWRRNIHQVNELGDTILGDVNNGNWEKAMENAYLIKHIYLRWAGSFKETSHDQ
ncbi:MAG: hypothetical protein HQL74_13560 [Magnetococcales bacterium]|nr:hypothetical protein [Magnetococcales bacterium]